MLKIPSNMNLGYVQEVLMLAMGWEGYHLKEIRHGNYTYFVRYAGGQDPEPVEYEAQRDSFKYKLGDLLKEQWDSFIYIYDLSYDWKHRVTLTEIAPCDEEDAKEDAVEHTLSPVKTPVRPKMLAAFRVMPKLYNLSTIRKTKNTNTFANGWAKILIHASSTSVALGGEWMISSASLARQGGDSIANSGTVKRRNLFLLVQIVLQ